MTESAEAKLARIEEKIDGLDKRLAERCQGSLGRILSLEKGQKHQGERIGRLEAADNKRKGAYAVLLALAGAAGAAGAFMERFFSAWAGR